MSKPESESCDCADGACCAASTGQGATGRATWHTVVFAAVLLAAVGVAAHSLLGRRTAPASGEVAAPDEALAGLDSVRAALADHEFVFIILPGQDASSDEAVAAAVSEAAAPIRARKVSVGVVTLSRDGDELDKAAGQFGVKAFPAVVALRKGGGQSVVEGEVTEDALLMAYVEACSPASCAPGSACCP